MNHQMEEYFDKHQCVIVPAGPMVNGRIDRWRFRVLDHTKSPRKPISEGNRELRDLDGTEFEFRSELRPSAKYLFFQYAPLILKARKKNAEAWSSSIGCGCGCSGQDNPRLRQLQSLARDEESSPSPTTPMEFARACYYSPTVMFLSPEYVTALCTLPDLLPFLGSEDDDFPVRLRRAGAVTPDQLVRGRPGHFQALVI